MILCTNFNNHYISFVSFSTQIANQHKIYKILYMLSFEYLLIDWYIIDFYAIDKYIILGF